MPDTLTDAVRRMEACIEKPCLSLADLAAKFGDMPLYRICFDPLPGHGTEQNVIDGEAHDRLFELIDGTLVEKTFSSYDGLLAGHFLFQLHGGGQRKSYGVVLGGKCAFRLRPGFVCMPDVSLFTFERAKKLNLIDPKGPPVTGAAPDLVVELINSQNSKLEMRAKIREYFAAGVREVWYAYVVDEELHQFRGPEDYRVLRGDDVLTSPLLLPGFECVVRNLLTDPFAGPSSL